MLLSLDPPDPGSRSPGFWILQILDPGILQTLDPGILEF